MEKNLIIGLLKEILPDEERVALTPDGVSDLVSKGYKVYIEKGAGQRFFSDEAYKEADAILTSKLEVIEKANFFPKIKQLSGENIEHKYNKENEIKLFANTINKYVEKSAKFILSFFFAEYLTDNDKELYKKANIKSINHDSNVLSVMSEITGQEMVKRGLEKYKELNENLIPRIAVVGAGSVGLSALKSISDEISKDLYVRDVDKAQKIIREENIQNVIFHNIEKLRSNLGKIDILIMALRDKKEDEKYLLTKDDLQKIKNDMIIMESATVCTWIEGVGGVNDHTSHDNQFRKEGEKIHLCLIPNYPAKSKEASSKVSELIVPQILQFKGMLSKNKELPIVEF